MGMGIALTIMVFIFVWFILKSQKETKKINEQYKKNLEDETIYIPELGQSISYDELTEEERSGESHFVKKEPVRKKTEEEEDFIDSIQLTETRRQWLDHAFLSLMNEFGRENLMKREVHTPDESDILWAEVHTSEDRMELVKKLAIIMEIDPDKITIELYNNSGIKESGGVYLENDQKNAAGLYYGTNEDGKYHIALDENSTKETDALIATIAHELSHVKLLGEKRIEENDEHLTDILPLIYGLGIFNANASFKFSKSNESWVWARLGYLSQMDWGYLFALFAFVREEKEPAWLEHLNVSVAADFKHATEFIENNAEIILLEDEH